MRLALYCLFSFFFISFTVEVGLVYCNRQTQVLMGHVFHKCGTDSHVMLKIYATVADSDTDYTTVYTV